MTEELKSAMEAFSTMNEEPAWLLAFREQAFAAFQTAELPYIEKVNYKRWGLMDITPPELLPSESSILGFDGLDQTHDNPYLVQVGQTTVVEQLSAKLQEQGVIFTDLMFAAREYPELVEPYLMKYAVKPDEDKFTALNAAFFTSGLFLYVPKNVVIDEAFEAVFVQEATRLQSHVHHVLIVAEENSQITYIEKVMTQGAIKNIANIVVEVIAKPGARVHFSAIDQMGENIHAFISRRGHLMKDSKIDWALGIMNEATVLGDFDSDLVGTGSHAEVKVVAISNEKQIQAIDTRVTNIGQHSIGHILQHGVILDRSTLTFNGIGHIIKGAKGADAQQESRVLMLSEKARGDANPILLIDENDVTAGHAASVGRVDEEDLYYLMSRGLPEKEAQRLVIRGFLGSVITAIPVKSIRQELIETIEGKLSDD